MKEIKLDKLKQVELDIFKEFIKVCDKINVNYFIMGGTLIGGIRHKGFIPWDDDIDIAMVRDEYDKFIKEAPRYLEKKYFLQTYETDSNYPQCFAKIRNSKTTFIETSVSDIDMNHGVYIDIFPLDNYHKISFWEKIKIILINIQLFKKYFSQNTQKKIIFLKFISKIIYGRKSNQKLCEIKDKIYKKNNDGETDKYTIFSGAWGVERETHSKEAFEDFILIDFEDIKCKAPKGYDKILTHTYGNYMELPPEEKRVTHHYTDVIDLDKPYTEYINKGKSN